MKGLRFLKKDSKLIRFSVISFIYFFSGLLYAGQIPDTGQTSCFDRINEIPFCPQKGEPFYGQDGNYIINPPSFTKLDEHGNALLSSATSWSVVMDNNTGLIWEVKTEDGSIHDKDYQYTWQQATDIFISYLNDINFGGYSDWRLPTIKELSHLFNRNLSEPAIDLNYFPNTIWMDSSVAWYWSSTSFANDNSKAWAAKYFQGRIDRNNSKISTRYVRAVRGSEYPDSPDGLFINFNNTVTDADSGLIWQQIGTNTSYWDGALSYCENLSLGGYTDWRLPNTNELLSIIDYNLYNLAIDTNYFQINMHCNSDGFWSSTSADTGSIAEMWFIQNYDGNLRPWFGKQGSYCTICVRGPISTYPTANAGVDQIVFDEITLDGSFSDAPDGEIISYQWTLIHRENSAYNRSAEGETSTVLNLKHGFYDVTLTIEDTNGGTDIDQMFFSATGLKGDFNFDGDVDGSDLFEFSEKFGLSE